MALRVNVHHETALRRRRHKDCCRNIAAADRRHWVRRNLARLVATTNEHHGKALGAGDAANDRPDLADPKPSP